MVPWCVKGRAAEIGLAKVIKKVIAAMLRQRSALPLCCIIYVRLYFMEYKFACYQKQQASFCSK